MKKILWIVPIFIILLLTACFNKEQKAYEEALQQAKEKISLEEFTEGKELLMKAVASGYEETDEAKKLLEQLERYGKLESLLNEGKFDDVFHEVEEITNIENGSTVISTKAKEYKESAKEKQQQFQELETIVKECHQLVEEKKYEEANERLRAIDLTKYEESYFDELKATIKETIAENDKQIAAIKEEKRKAEEERKRAEAERKAREEAERKAKEEAKQKRNMLGWSSEEIHHFIANYFGLNPNHVIVEVYDRSNTGYNIEARHNNAAAGKGDPLVAPALGFFKVDENGKLYEMDIVNNVYVPVN